MAYGKQPIENANVGGWRQQAGVRQEEKKKITQRKPYTGSRFANIYKPPMGEFELIRLIPGQYKVPQPVDLGGGKFGVKNVTLPYFECIDHFDGRNGQSCICSSGPLGFRKQHALPCIGCAGFYLSPKDAENRRRGRFSRRQLYVWNVLAYGTFVKIEQVDRNTGLVKLSDTTGKPYTEWVRKSKWNPAGLEEKEGHLMHWSVGSAHMETIQGYDDIISKTCKNCGTGPDAIRRRALLCQKCGTDVIDCNSTNLQPADIQKMLFLDVECTYCHHVAPLQSFDECCGCDNPVRTCCFDVDINITRMESVGNQTQLVFSSWSPPHPVDASYKIFPYDLAAMYAPDSIETQEKRFRLKLADVENTDMSEVPRTEKSPQPGAQAFRNYGGST